MLRLGGFGKGLSLSPTERSTITAPGWGIVLERGTTALLLPLHPVSLSSSRSMSSPSTSSMWLSVSIQGSVCWWKGGCGGRRLEDSLGEWFLILGRLSHCKGTLGTIRSEHYCLLLEQSSKPQDLLSMLAFSVALC